MNLCTSVTESVTTGYSASAAPFSLVEMAQTLSLQYVVQGRGYFAIYL